MQETQPLAGTDTGSKTDTTKAIGLMILALVLFSMLDTTAKLLLTRVEIPAPQVIWMRFSMQSLVMLTLIPLTGILSLKELVLVEQPGFQMLRSLAMALTTAFNFLALQYLRLDQTITIMFLTPLVVSLLAGPLLGEWVGWRRLLAILVGFCGILIAVRPGISNVHPAVGFAFAAMLAYTAFILLTRHTASRAPPLATLFFSLHVGVLLAAPLALNVWVWPPSSVAWLMLAALGLFGGIGHYLFIIAHRLAPAAIIAPFIYMQIISMIILGYLVFDDVPDIWTLLGSAIIVASGVYLFHRERVTAKH